MSEPDKTNCHWEIDFKHGTYRLMRGDKEVQRFLTLSELNRYVRIKSEQEHSREHTR